jgi:hypothetical protein
MNDVIVSNSLRFLGLFFVQVLILINVDINTTYVNLYIYPLIILILPVHIQKVLLLVIAFILGIGVDMFYDTTGVNAAAAVLTAYLRSNVLDAIKPKGGYEQNHVPTKHQFGTGWFLRYAGILFFIHLFVVFFLERLSFSNFGSLLLKTVLSYFLSMILVIIYMFLFNPKR